MAGKIKSERMYMHKYTLLAAYLPDGTSITGIPSQQEDWGKYSAVYPQDAASKAYSNVQKYIKKYRDPWFMDIEPDKPMVLVLHETSERESKRGPDDYIYYVFREVAQQSRNGPRVVVNVRGRVREYKWKNRAVPMKEGETPEEAMGRYHVRSELARNRKIAFGAPMRPSPKKSE